MVDGTMRNESDERGAKLLTGSRYWTNYSIEADVYLLGASGDAGLIIRSSNEEEGVNSYSGYYAGIRTGDSTLVLGRADHSWLEASNQRTVPGGIHPYQWYHLKLLAYNCDIAVAVMGNASEPRTAFGVTDSDCLRHGRVGLRSYSSGGIWRNVVVRTATRTDLGNLLAGNGLTREQPAKDFVAKDSESIRERQMEQDQQSLPSPEANTQSIASLSLTSFSTPAKATVRGVVVLVAPRLYVQDSTGGVYVQAQHPPLLRVGDEVEVTGLSHQSDFSANLEQATVRVLWVRTPIPPVSVTASQAATGRFAGTFVEVRGRLTGKERGPGNTLVLDLDEGSQSFRAIMNPGRSDQRFDQLKLNSTLQLRGVCAVDPILTNRLTPFVILLRSNEDLDLLAGPPWWSAKHILALIAALVLLTLVSVSLYHRVENWRLRAVLEVRERLAHEMHDTLAQSFAGIGFQLQAIRNGLTPEMTTIGQQLELASSLVRHGHDEARRSIATLRTDDFRSEDVLSALAHCAHQMVAGGTVQILTREDGAARPIPLRTTDTLYRIGQEAIANAVRHAEAELISIYMAYDNNSVHLEVEDDGRGFAQDKERFGFGIRGMRRRAQGIDARFDVQSGPGKGTCIRVDAPLPPRPTVVSWLKSMWLTLIGKRIHV
ncbi:hypothetical protein GCM10011507_31920 [Edaphobacter acidisoli]|uniref:Histidine kinase domain-containing protein n=1 Tax=Edaphobacter acidisoli TaxID=2040573 RepID=A0A916S0Q6_9BACT|nr:hypothetical protein GCM10011507_31920 [Edaphobacter acidisoli]